MMRVDFPQPTGPTIPTIPPAGSTSERGPTSKIGKPLPPAGEAAAVCAASAFFGAKMRVAFCKEGWHFDMCSSDAQLKRASSRRIPTLFPSSSPLFCCLSCCCITLARQALRCSAREGASGRRKNASMRCCDAVQSHQRLHTSSRGNFQRLACCGPLATQSKSN